MVIGPILILKRSQLSGAYAALCWHALVTMCISSIIQCMYLITTACSSGSAARCGVMIMTVCCQWQYAVNDSMLSMTVCCQWQYAVNDSMLSMTVCCQWRYAVNDMLSCCQWQYAVNDSMLSMTVCCCQWRYAVNDGMLSMTVCCQWRYAVNDGMLSMTVCCQWRYAVNDMHVRVQQSLFIFSGQWRTCEQFAPIDLIWFCTYTDVILGAFWVSVKKNPQATWAELEPTTSCRHSESTEYTVLHTLRRCKGKIKSNQLFITRCKNFINCSSWKLFLEKQNSKEVVATPKLSVFQNNISIFQYLLSDYIWQICWKILHLNILNSKRNANVCSDPVQSHYDGKFIQRVKTKFGQNVLWTFVF